MAKWGEVIEITPFMKQGDTGDFEDWVRIRAKTRLGVIFHEELPKKDATPSHVEELLTSKAAEWDKIKSL